MKKVYICASLRPEVYSHVTDVLASLPEAIYLRPWTAQPGNRIGHVETDVAMIKHCDELWVVGQFGRDCSWEIGFATALGIKVVVYKDHTNAKMICDDWMFYHGITQGTLTIVELDKK